MPACDGQSSLQKADPVSSWGEHLAGVEPALSLPKGRAAPEAGPPRMGKREVALDRDLARCLESLASKNELALAELWLGAFFVFLFRYTEQRDLLIAQTLSPDPVASPGSEGEGGTGGPAVRSSGSARVVPCAGRENEWALPVRMSIREEASFIEFARSLKAALAQLTQLGSPPPSALSETACAGQGEVFSPLVRFGMVCQGGSGATGPRPGGESLGESGPCELGLTVFAGQEVRLCFAYNERRYPSSSVEWMARHYVQLLRSIELNPNESLADLALMTAEEEPLIRQWSCGARPRGDDLLPHQLFQLHAEQTPEAPAVVYEGGQLAFRELDRQANQLAHHLRTLGVGPEVLAAICMELSPEMVVATLAILKAGGGILWLDAAAPRERLAALLEQAEPAVLLTKARHAGEWQSLCPRRVLVDREGPVLARLPVSPPANLVGPRNMGFVFGTSGSTGQPKLVVQSHGLCGRGSLAEKPGRHLLKSSSGTSFTAAEIMTVTSGNTLFIVPEGVEHDLERLVAFIGRHQITEVTLVPSALRALLALDDLSACRCLRTVDCIGEMVSPELKRLCFERLEADFVVSYGCTEARSATTRSISRQDDPGCVDAGRTNPGMELYILDPKRRLVPIGMPGEVYAGGRIATGYLKDPQRTADRFVPHPFESAPGARLFRTGDLGRWLPGGCLEILGRLDYQVKIRGFRIEPAEIEAVLCRHPVVKQAAVVARETLPGARELVAYIATDAPKAELAGVRDFLREKLPEPMLPARFVVLDKMPRTANGKCDRRSLPSPEGRELSLKTGASAPRNATERMLVPIWGSVLGKSEVGTRDSFFDLGGDSLLAIRLIAEVKRFFGQALPVATLLESPTIEVMARRLVESPGGPRWEALVPLQPRGSRPPFYFVHGWGGGVFRFLELARALGPDQPSFGLQAVGFDEERKRHARVEEMAAHYAREIRAFQPQGPYYLGGFSAGGWVAYATAVELKRQGERVAMLAMLDTNSSPLLPWSLYLRVKVPYFLRRLRFHWNTCESMSFHERRRYLVERWAALRRQLERDRRPLARPRQSRARAAAEDASLDHYARAILAYQPPCYDAPVDFFLAEDNAVEQLAAVMCFFKGGMNLHRVSGSHLEIIDRNHIRGFSQVFGRALAAAQQKQTAPGQNA